MFCPKYQAIQKKLKDFLGVSYKANRSFVVSLWAGIKSTQCGYIGYLRLFSTAHYNAFGYFFSL